MKQDRPKPKTSLFGMLARFLALQALVQNKNETDLEIFSKMLNRKWENGGRMAFSSDFRKVHLHTLKMRKGIR